MKTTLIKYILVTLFLFLFCNLDAQIFKVTSTNAQVGYQNYKWLGLGFNATNPTSNSSQWGIEHWDGGFNIWKPWPSAYSGNYKFFIRDEGNVGIGMKPILPTNFFWAWYFTLMKLQINGYGIANGWVTWSDSALKENIIQIDSTYMSKLFQLNPVMYHFKTDANLGGDYDTEDSSEVKDSTIKSQGAINRINENGLLHFGFTAQQVKNVFPNIVFNCGNAEGINYVELIPVLVKAIQDQQKQIADQKAQIQLIKNLTPSTTTKSVLYQNDPNPFGVHTTFTYYIDETISVTNAVIEIRDLTGVLKTSITLTDQSGLGEVTYDGTNLNVGYYVYSLKVNGSNKDSKMLLIDR